MSTVSHAGRELILGLSRECGEVAADEDVVATWTVDHGCCCVLHVDEAARGDAGVLGAIRRCMGLPDAR